MAGYLVEMGILKRSPALLTLPDIAFRDSGFRLFESSVGLWKAQKCCLQRRLGPCRLWSRWWPWMGQMKDKKLAVWQSNGHDGYIVRDLDFKCMCTLYAAAFDSILNVNMSLEERIGMNDVSGLVRHLRNSVVRDKQLCCWYFLWDYSVNWEESVQALLATKLGITS